MKDVFEILEQLRATSSSKEKMNILLSNRGNDNLKQYLRLTYEPRINFYVKAVDPYLAPLYTSSMFDIDPIEFDQCFMRAVYETIAKRAKTGGAARRWLAEKYHQLDSVGQELLKLLIQRDVKCGISFTTINKVWPGLVTAVPYMRCSLLKEVDLDSWPWERGVYSQIKADGMFANISHHFNAVTIESRAGSPFPVEFFPDLVQDIKNLIPQGQQLHGELLVKKSGQILPREVGNGMFNSALQGTPLEADCVPIFQAWDMIPITEAFSKNEYKVPYEERLQELVMCLIFDSKALHIIEMEKVNSLNQAYDHYKKARQRGLEGTVIKHPDGIWEDRTSKNQVKLKLEFNVDLLVVGFNAADPKSKNASTFGSLLCQTSDGLLEVGVTGLKDDVRQSLWDRRDSIINNLVIEVCSNGIMAPTVTGGKYSLFLPRFGAERPDKKVADSLERVQQIQKSTIELGVVAGK